MTDDDHLLLMRNLFANFAGTEMFLIDFHVLKVFTMFAVGNDDRNLGKTMFFGRLIWVVLVVRSPRYSVLVSMKLTCTCCS